MQSTSIEIWRPVLGYEGSYEVSNRGSVRSVDRQILRAGRIVNLKGKTLSPGHAKINGIRTGKLVYNLRRDGKGSMKYAHVMVLESFVGPRPENKEGCHRDDDGSNNILSNLYWGTRSENLYDAVRNGRHWAANKTHCKHGHEFNAENTDFNKRGNRQCRACRRDSRVRQREARAAAA